MAISLSPQRVFKYFALLFTVLGVVWLMKDKALAIDAPHYAGNSVQCLSCHQPHNTAGNNLTKAGTNPLVCQQCHSSGGSAAFFPMQDSDRAVPKVSGNSHQWSVNANNSTYGASVPPNTYSQNSDADMYMRVDTSDPANPKIVCSTCHNQHDNSNKWGRIHLSSVTRVAGIGATGTVTYAASDHGAKAQGYLVEIVAGGPLGTATYIFQDGSLDSSGNLKWYGWNGTAWVAYTGTAAHDAAATAARATGATQQLRDGANLTITFDTASNNFQIGDQFKFYTAYPFLRRAHDSGGGSPSSPQGGATYFCRNCHSERAQSYTDVETWTGGNRSHPVGHALGANGQEYDGNNIPQDADGADQDGSANSPDGNWTNDLLLFPSGTAGNPVYPTTAASRFGDPLTGDVQCMTCHAPHFADANSKTIDKR